MSSNGKLTAGHYACAGCVFLALLSLVEFVAIGNLQSSFETQLRSAESRIGTLETAVANLESRERQREQRAVTVERRQCVALPDDGARPRQSSE